LSKITHLTDGLTDRILIVRLHLHYMQHGKNGNKVMHSKTL